MLTAEGMTVSRHRYYLSKLRVSSVSQPSNQQQHGFWKHCATALFAQECERKCRSQAWDFGEHSPPPNETICGLVWDNGWCLLGTAWGDIQRHAQLDQHNIPAIILHCWARYQEWPEGSSLENQDQDAALTIAIQYFTGGQATCHQLGHTPCI